jgi:hypothetical protein
MFHLLSLEGTAVIRLKAAFLMAGAALLAPAIPALAAPGDQLTDAREQAPVGLMGMWMADLEASTFPGAKPKAMLRSFAYTEDGRVLVSFATHNAQGAVSSGHWAAQVDGTPAIEYHSSANSVPYNVVSWRLVGEGRLDLTVSRHGKVDGTGSYQLAADGQTLTYTYGEMTAIYRRWNMVD